MVKHLNLTSTSMCEAEPDANFDLLAALQQCSDGSEIDKELITRFETVLNSQPGSDAQKRAISRLISKVFKLPGILKSDHPDYPEARSLALNWFSTRWQIFKPGKPSIHQSLVRWINAYLYWRIRELNMPDGNAPFSLNQGIVNDDEQKTELLDTVASGSFEEVINGQPSLSGLDKYCQDRVKEKVDNLATKVEDYINHDPKDKLKACHPSKYPEANCQYLVQCFCLKDPPDSKAEVARDLEIPQQTLYAHWNRKCQPLLASIGLELGYDNEKLKRAIEQDLTGELTNLYPGKLAKCNAQYLAMRLLPMFSEPSLTFAEIAQDLQNQNSNINPDKIETFWEKKCLKLLGNIAIRIGYQAPGEV